MVDGTVGIAQCPTPDRLMDNEVLTIGLNQVYRQRVQDPEARVVLDGILTELNGKFEAGQEVALDAASLAALENITVEVSDWPTDFPDADVLAKLEQIRLLLAGTVTVDGEVALDAATLAALENITVTVANFPASVEIANDVGNPVPVTGTVTVNEPVSVDDNGGSLTVDGTVAVSSVGGTVAVSGPLTDTQLRATPVPVSGPLTDVQVRATPLPVSGTVTITDGSGPVTVDGTVGVSGSVAVTGPLTDTQLRATPVPVGDLNKLVPVRHDEVQLGYTGDNLTSVVFKQATVTVATLALAYTGDRLDSVVRS